MSRSGQHDTTIFCACLGDVDSSWVLACVFNGAMNMKYFIMVQTALNLWAAVGSKDVGGRVACLAFGIWGGTLLVLEYFH